MIKNHYQQFHKTKSGWIHTEDYHVFWLKQIEKLLNLGPNLNYLDLGCGRAEISKDLTMNLSLNSNLIDAYYSDRIVKIADALEYSKTQEPSRYDAILLKQVIHHFSGDYRKNLLTEIYRILKPGGRVLILAMPEKIDVPLPAKALQYYSEDNFEFDKLYSCLNELGFHLKTEDIAYPVRITKEEHFKTLRNCYISTLSKLNSDEMESGIQKLDQKIQGNFLEFSDTLRAIVGTR